MQRTLVGVVAGACFALSAGVPGCDDDEPGPRHHDEGGSAGEATGGSAGDSTGGSIDGGEGGVPSAGGTGQGGSDKGGVGGTAGTSGSSPGGAGEGGNTGGSGGAGDGPDQLTICLRLQRAGQLAFDVTLGYESALIADCRVNWVTTQYFDSSINLNERDIFLNNLLVWNLGLWGCNAIPPTDFALIYHPAPLTSADAQALIDDYVEVATDLLSMSAPEVAEMRALLGRLSEPVIEEVTDEYSNSACTGGAGGAAGAGGT